MELGGSRMEVLRWNLEVVCSDGGGSRLRWNLEVVGSDGTWR